MYNKSIQKLLKKKSSNLGFTLTELLAGLVMSIFVTGALGFGLYQILVLTKKGTEQTNVRNEASRAIEFISDEIRRAQNLDDDLLADLDGDGVESENPAPNFNPTGKTVALVLNIAEVDNSDTLGTDGDATTPERIIYYLQNSSGNWQGPKVLYRWGPPLDSEGNYTTGAWQNEALIDGIDDSDQTATCNGNTITYQGFYACINPTSTSAQLFLTGGIDTIAGNNTANDETYTASTETVARARVADVNDTGVVADDAITFKSLDPGYVCDPNAAAPDDEWMMRMDFNNNPYDPSAINNSTRWIHEPGRQPQPVNVSQDNPNDLQIYSSPVGRDNCLSTGNPTSAGFTQDSDLSDITTNGHTVSYTIKFQASVAGRSDDPNFWHSFNGDTSGGYDNPNVTSDGTVLVLKNGSILDPNATPSNTDGRAPLYPGYDFDNDGTPDKESLGEFLATSGYADDNGDGTFTIKGLADNQRLVAVEIGQVDNGTTSDPDGNGQAHPGFDLQDNIVIMTNENFAKEY